MALRIDYGSRSFGEIKQSLKDAIDQFLPEWTDRSDTDMGIVLLELFAYVGDLISFHTNNAANEALFVTATQTSSLLSMAKMLNYSVRSQQAASTQQIFKLSALQGITTTVPARTLIQSTKNATLLFETVEDLNIPAGKWGDEQTTPGTYDYQVEARNSVTGVDEIVGSIQPRADGSLDFVEMELLQFPVIKETVEVQVFDGLVWNAWNRKDLFVDSGPADHDFTVSIDENGKAKIRFGNGTLGAIPEVGIDNVRASYSFSGLGKSGNGVLAGELTIMATPIAQIERTFNSTVSSGGEDFGNVEEIKKNMPYAWSALDRAVGDQDYVTLTKAYGGIAKASVVFNETSRVIEIYALPTGGGLLSPSQKEALLAYELEKSVMGRDVEIKDPFFVSVNGAFEVACYPTYDSATVLADVGVALQDFFAYDNRDLGQSEFLSNIFGLVENVPGVNYVNVTEFYRVPQTRPASYNTGLGLFTPVVINENTTARTWVVKMNSLSVFEVRSGITVSNGTLGTPFDNGEIAFTLTAGAIAPQIGDEWSIRTSSKLGNILVDPLEILEEGTLSVLPA